MPLLAVLSGCHALVGYESSAGDGAAVELGVLPKSDLRPMDLAGGGDGGGTDAHKTDAHKTDAHKTDGAAGLCVGGALEGWPTAHLDPAMAVGTWRGAGGGVEADPGTTTRATAQAAIVQPWGVVSQLPGFSVTVRAVSQLAQAPVGVSGPGIIVTEKMPASTTLTTDAVWCSISRNGAAWQVARGRCIGTSSCIIHDRVNLGGGFDPTMAAELTLVVTAAGELGCSAEQHGVKTNLPLVPVSQVHPQQKPPTLVALYAIDRPARFTSLTFCHP